MTRERVQELMSYGIGWVRYGRWSLIRDGTGLEYGGQKDNIIGDATVVFVEEVLQLLFLHLHLIFIMISAKKHNFQKAPHLS